MAILRVIFRSAAVSFLLLALIAGRTLAQSPVPAPGPTSDGMNMLSSSQIAYFDLILIYVCLWWHWHFRDDNRPRNSLLADAVGLGPHLPNSPARRIVFKLQTILLISFSAWNSETETCSKSRSCL